MAAYELPDLPYDYAALEPHISARILELHHDRHHAGYVEKANAALDELEEAREQDDMQKVWHLERKLAFNLSGHILHSIFWGNLAPGAGGEPDGELADAIANDFGSFARFRKQMTQTAATVMGSGWAALVWEPLSGCLVTTQVHDHQSNLTQGSVPIMVIDAWEHAYYLQYENRKEEFFDSIWNLWNWDDIAARFTMAQSRSSGLLVPTPG
jgi:Fe-Mn family superoxide dismutase